MGDLTAHPSEATSSWTSSDRTVVLGVAERQARPRSKPSLTQHRGCVLALDGRLLGQAAGPAQASLSPAESMVEHYLHDGDDFVRHLEGDFAFVLWDATRRRLVSGCDVMGRRTLAFYWDGTTFLACTRAIALLRDRRVPRIIDGVYLAQALCDLWVHPPGLTAFTRIRRLRPGFSVIVADGRLIERRVDQLAFQERRHTHASNAEYDGFWARLDGATRARLGAQTPAGVLFSGGLDSSCALASVTHSYESVDAFSIVDRPTPSEHAAITTMLARHPSVRWHSIACPTDSPAGEALDNLLPIADDPVIAGGPLFGSRAALWRAVVNSGFSVAADGEGGDEIFDIAMRLGDLVADRAWRAGARYLLGQPIRRQKSLLWRGVVFPHLPDRIRHIWMSMRGRRNRGSPAWLTDTFWRGREIQAAIEHTYDWSKRWTFEEWLPGLLENAPSVGTTQANRVCQQAHALELTSPLFDRQIAEFVSGLPASTRLHPRESKHFLRSAAAGFVPEVTRIRPKEEPLYQRLLREILESPRSVSQVQFAAAGGLPPGWLDVDAATRTLDRARAGGQISEKTQLQLHAVLAIAGWWKRMVATYGSMVWSTS